MEATTEKESKGILLSFDQSLYNKYLKTFDSIKLSLLNEYVPLLQACGLTLNRESLNWLNSSTSERSTDALLAIKRELKSKSDKPLADLYLKSIKSNIDDLQSYLSRFEPRYFFAVGMMSEGTQFYSKWISIDKNGQLYLSDTSIEEIRDHCSIHIPGNHYFHILTSLDEFKTWYNEKFIGLMRNYGIIPNLEVIQQIFNIDLDNDHIEIDPNGIQWLLQMKRYNNPAFEPNPIENIKKMGLDFSKTIKVLKDSFVDRKNEYEQAKSNAELDLNNYLNHLFEDVKKSPVHQEVVDSFVKKIASFTSVISSYNNVIDSFNKIREKV